MCSYFMLFRSSSCNNSWINCLEMDDKDSEPLVQYLAGKITFAEWLEQSSKKSQRAEGSNKKRNEVLESSVGDDGQPDDSDEDMPDDSEPSEINTSTVPSPASIVESEENMHENTSAASPPQEDIISPLSSQPSTSQDVPTRMTDLLLGLPAAQNAKKHGGTSVDEFFAEIPSMSRKGKSTGRPKRHVVPQKYQRQIGEANISCAKGDYERAKEICIEVIKEVPKCAEPFQVLGMVYEMQNDMKKALQFFLIAAYLKKSEDVEEWLKLASMSLEQDNYKQALTCYNQALKCDPNNLGILWDRAALCYQMGDIKKALEYYQAVLKALPADDVDRFMDLATEMATIYHEHDSLKDAIDVMDMAFARNPSCTDFRAINMLAELYITAKHYSQALNFICTSCNITQVLTAVEPQTSEPLSSFSDILGYDREQSPQKAKAPLSSKIAMNSDAKWIVNEETPIDLRVKTVVCLIYMRNLAPVKDIIAPLYLERIESAGDLYLDVAEAYAENSDYDKALPIFDMLVATDKYNQAGVWLKKAQSLMSLGRLDEAVMAFNQVVSLAPGHMEARLTLASLLQQLGQHEKALEILTNKPSEQDTSGVNTPMDTLDNEGDAQSINEAEEEAASDNVQPQDFRLLFHKCTLLKSQDRLQEFTESGYQLFTMYFSDVSKLSTDAIIECAGIKLAKNRKQFWQSSRIEDPRDKRKGGDNSVRKEEWWDMLKQLIIEMSRLKLNEEALHLSMCGVASERFMYCKDFQKELQFMSIIALFLAGRNRLAFDFIRQTLIDKPQNVVLWNMFGQLVAHSEDSRHHRYCLRLLIKYPDLLPLVIINGHNSFVAGSFKFAIAEYVRAFRQSPDNPLISLCLGIQYLHLAGQRFPVKRHANLIQGFLFLFQYMSLRGEGQETYYNIGRGFHQLGLFHFAVHYYKKALDCPYHHANKASNGHDPAKVSVKHDLHREAAYNLSLIYRGSGNYALAKETISKYIVF